MTEQLMELADRCEKATGPDREMDTGIAKTLGLTDQRTHMSPQGLGYVDRNQWAVARVEHYTASLDSAMRLVPEGEFVCLDGPRKYLDIPTPVPNYWRACIGYAPEARAWAMTAALALCAAALRARAQSENLGGGDE